METIGGNCEQTVHRKKNYKITNKLMKDVQCRK